MNKLTATLLATLFAFANAAYADDSMKQDGMAKPMMAKKAMKQDGMHKKEMKSDMKSDMKDDMKSAPMAGEMKKDAMAADTMAKPAH